MEPSNTLCLWEKCRSNDRQAQNELYQQFASKMYAVALRYAKDTAEAQDILQNGFIKVFTKTEYYQGRGSLEGWIRRVIVNTAIEHLRKNKMSFLSMDQITYHPGISCPSLRQLDYKDLLDIIQQLPVGYRTVFNLYAIEGYAHKEIAEMLQINEGSSKSQLSRARIWLQKRIQKMEELEL